jgi:hypothetical protein
MGYLKFHTLMCAVRRTIHTNPRVGHTFYSLYKVLSDIQWGGVPLDVGLIAHRFTKKSVVWLM